MKIRSREAKIRINYSVLDTLQKTISMPVNSANDVTVFAFILSRNA